MKFLVTATPKQVPLLPLEAVRRAQAWHESNASLGCLMRVSATGCLVGILESGNRAGLLDALLSYPDGGCYEWHVEAVVPMTEACGAELTARSAPYAARDASCSTPGSVFPDWMGSGLKS